MNWDQLNEGSHPLCQKGCKDHSITTEPLTVNLKHSVPDYPVAREQIDMSFYHVERTLNEDVPGYCPGLDTIVDSIRINGTWEGFETTLFQQLLEDNDDMVLDFGASVGWYTMLASKSGNRVIAIEADNEIRKGLERTLEDAVAPVTLYSGFVGPHTAVLDATSAPRIRILKADVEGAEGEVMRICHDLFAAHKIDYAIIELTPVFTSWPYVQEQLAETMALGYTLRMIPDKGYNVSLFEADPLACTLKNNAKIEKDQEMGLLIREELV